MTSILQATGKIVNNTAYDLSVLKSALTAGRWDQTPVGVAAGTTTTAFIAQGDPGDPAGTSGSVQYSLHNTDAVITVCWDDPYTGSNSTGGTGSNQSNFTVSASVPSGGSEVTFTYTVNGS